MKISVLGMGLMGAPMALKLHQGGHQVIAYNRTPTKLEPLQAEGVAITSNPVEALQETDGVVLMVTDRDAIASLLFDDTTHALLTDKTIIQMGTIAPTHSRELLQTVMAAGGDYLEAPVLGSIPQVQQGSLIVMVGATPEQYRIWKPVLSCFGPEPMLVGEVGTAAAAKLAMNQLIGSLTTAFALSLGFAQKQGLDIEILMTILRQSALYAPTFDKKLQRMCDRDYSKPNFPSKHLLKDMDLFAEEAHQCGLDARLAETVSQVVQQAIALGYQDEDYSALFSAIAPTSSETPHS
ncbi:MAG: NAD(P)-dependent oxidoreductase [Cyanothece sp. SIO2G6]|nr:NAD(P)-dependent oxidoreductase [Cyanothece sp. SIO2G6]